MPRIHTPGSLFPLLIAFVAVLFWTGSGRADEHALPTEAEQKSAEAPTGMHGEGHGEGHEEGHDEAHDEGHDEGHGGHHGHRPHHRYFLGVLGTGLAVLADEGTSSHFGVGAFFEIEAIAGWLEFELSLRVLSAQTGVELPIELLIKKPFHVNHWFHPFLGIGPALVPAFLDEGNSVHGGGAAAVGAHFWITSDVALMAEFNYNLIYDNGLVHELGDICRGPGRLVNFAPVHRGWRA